MCQLIASKKIILYFQVYSVVVILYRVATFNDCNEAADELKKVRYKLLYLKIRC